MPNYISLRDENAFPKFVDLPDDTGIYGGMRKKHWCMIAEIVDMDALVRFVLHVKDKAGTIFKVAFYTDGRGFECKTADVKPGYTVAILYPYQHEFLDLSFGIRVDDPKFVKVIPSSLDKLLRLSDEIQSKASFGNRYRCHGCENEKEGLKRCARCGVFWYCNKDCQAFGWKEKGHKIDCKILRDVELQKLLGMDWSCFNGFKSFAMPK